tara:strand:+ start:81 stop:788 length:708 start_codon:yes stop_codon:yes gene_type:complete
MAEFSIEEAKNNDMLYQCIADITDDLPNPDQLALDRTAKAATNTFDYVGMLFVEPSDKLIKEECGGKFGNKYLIEYGECKTGSQKETTYKIVDTTCNMGTIPCVANSIYKFGTNTGDLFKNVFDFEQPNCSDLSSQNPELHVMKNGRMQTGSLFENIDGVYIVEDFGNLYDKVVNHLEGKNYTNEYLNENNKDNNSIDRNSIDINSINGNFINDIYYTFLIIFLLFIIYKISNKK